MAVFLALLFLLRIDGLLLAAILLIEPARHLFAFGPLHGDDVAVALAVGIAALGLLELLKRMVSPGGPPLPA